MYDRALSPDEIADMTKAGTKSLLENTLDNLSIADHNGLNSVDGIMQDLAMPADADVFASGGQITWRSKTPDVISDTGVCGEASAPTSATMIATLTRGESTATKEYELTVVPKGEIKADPVEVVTAIGARPDLPERISANGGKASVVVTWDLPEETAYATMYAGVGSFTVKGTTSAGESVAATVKVEKDLYTNPLILPPSPDPFITYHDGYYYYIKSSGGLNIAKARRLQDIGSAELKCVYSASGSGYSEFWAPELHYVDGCWYIYVAPVPSGTGNRRMYVLKSTEPDNAQAPYEMVGVMGPTVYNEETEKWEINPDTAQNRYALDGTVVEAAGKKYFIYSAHLGTGGQPTTQDIYINEMYDATTLMGDRVKLPAGGARFEKMCNIGNHIAEGPQILKRNGKVYVFYSTDMSNTDWYQVCVMYADENSDLLNPDNWTKHPGPLLTKSLNPNDEIYAPGHACVVTSPDGKEDYLVYHAYSSHNASNRTGAQEARCARVIKIGWNGHIPVLGYAQPLDALNEAPAGEGKSVALKIEGELGMLSGGASVVRDLPRASQHAVVGNITGSATATYKFNITTPGKYLITVQGCAMQSGNAYQDITVNGVKTTLRYRTNYSGGYRFMPSCITDGEMLGEGLYVDLPAGETTIVLSANAQSAAAVAIDYIYLLNEDVPQPSEITLDVESLELTAGESTKLNATINPESDMTITWTSSDESVATVDENGNVTAVGEGTAEITATLPDGGTVTCPVSVRAPAFIPGDVDKSGAVDVADIMKLKALIMADTWSDEELLIGDLDQSKRLDVGDIMAVKNIIMSA